MFDLREISRFLGRPVTLYRFTRQHLAWRYTDADRPISIGAETFEPLPVSRGKVQESTERAKNNLTITLPRDAAVAANWQPYPPSDPVLVTVMETHYGDPDQGTRVVWSGRVASPKFTDTTLELTCEPARSGARRGGLALRWSRGCPLPLYSQGVGMCNVQPDAWAVPAVLAAVDGLVLEAPEFAPLPAGRLAGGYLEWTRADGLTETRTIMHHAAAAIELNYGAEDLAAGAAVTAYPGCPHNWGGCESFNNTPNYGGAMFLPGKNPFGGNPIW